MFVVVYYSATRQSKFIEKGISNLLRSNNQRQLWIPKSFFHVERRKKNIVEGNDWVMGWVRQLGLRGACEVTEAWDEFEELSNAILKSFMTQLWRTPQTHRIHTQKNDGNKQQQLVKVISYWETVRMAHRKKTYWKFTVTFFG